MTEREIELRMCEQFAEYFKAKADEAWKRGMQERAETFEEVVQDFTPQIVILRDTD